MFSSSNVSRYQRPCRRRLYQMERPLLGLRYELTVKRWGAGLADKT